MKRFSRGISYAAAAALLLSLAAGCGGKPKTPGTSQTQTSAASSQEAAQTTYGEAESSYPQESGVTNGQGTTNQPGKSTGKKPTQKTTNATKGTTSASSSQMGVINKSDTDVQSDKTKAEKAKLNFGGQTVTIAYTWVPSKKGENASVDRWYARMAEVEKKYNVKIVEKQGSTNYNENMITSVLGGSPMGHILQSTTHFSWIKAGIMANLNSAMEKSGIDFRAGRYSQMVRQYTRLNGKQYAFGFGDGDISDVWLFNRRIFSEMKIDPYELVKNKQWTWDKVEEIAKKATKRAANGNVEQWGLAGWMAGHMAASMAWENGGSIASVGKNGKPLVTMNDAKVRTAFERLYKWGSVDKILKANGGDQNWDALMIEFSKGNIAMLAGTSGAIGTCYQQGMADGFGVVYPPLGPSQTDYCYNVDLGTVFFVPVTYEKDAWKYLLLMDELYAPYSDSKDALFPGTVDSLL